MKAENLIKLLDALTETSVYVIEESTHNLLFFNERCREISRGRAALGVKCNEVWPEMCVDCPLGGLKDGSSNHVVCYDPLLKITVDLTAGRIEWDGKIPAVVVTATPHKLNFEEEQGLKKIERMYAQSLVTVFDECIIANLTLDTYVNCQKDAMWTDIPEQGNFAAENLKYAAQTLHPDDYTAFVENFSREAMLRLFGEGRERIVKRLRRRVNGAEYHMVEFVAARLDAPPEDGCWCVLVYRDKQEEYLAEQRRGMEISQLATAARFAYQMLISVDLTQNTYHMLEYDRIPVRKPEDSGVFDDLIRAEVSTVRPDCRDEFLRKFSRQSLTDEFTHGGRIVTMEVPHLGDDGVYHWNFTQVVCVESPYTDHLTEITLSRSIDEQRRRQAEALEKERKAKQLLEDALLKAEKASRAKSDFLSKMSHDIRTPMNAIVGMTELAQLHVGEEERMRDYLAKIAASGAHLLGLINEVLDVSKIESGTFELQETDFDLRELIGEAAGMVKYSCEKKAIGLSVNIEEGLHTPVTGDVRRLKQVLVNILENSAKYSRAGGAIKLSLKETNKNERRAGTYIFTVEDNGIGMRPEFLQHIFEPFSRADDSRVSKISGTGLGMTIVKNLVSMMNGTVDVESKYGIGSRFIITLRLPKREQKAIPAAAGRAPDASFGDLRVLLVEDNELNRQIAAEMLELIGAKVESAEDGRQGVDVLLKCEPAYYDIVLMDIQMPNLNGYDATREIRGSGRADLATLPIIAMTADAFADDAKKALLAGMNGHLPKPISLTRLKKAIGDCLAPTRQTRP